MLTTTVIRPIGFALMLLLGGSRAPDAPPGPRLLRQIETHGRITDSRGTEIIVTTDRIQFLGQTSGLTRELLLPDPERTRVTLPKAFQGTLLQTIAHGVSDKGPESVELRVLNREGVVLWTTERMSIGPLFLSEADGPRIVERICHEGGCTAAIRIIDRNQPQGLQIDPKVEPPARSNGGDIAADGKTFAITFEGDSDRSSLVYFDIDGHELWAHHKENAQGNEVGVSPAGNFVVATIRETNPRRNRITLFSRDGRVIGQEDAEYVGDYRFAFSDDETTLAVGASSGSLVVFDTSTQRVRWRYATRTANTGFIDLDVCDGFVIASVTTLNPSDLSDGSLPRFVYLFDRNGKVLFTMKFDGSEFETWQDGPRVQFVRPDGTEVLITLKERILRYSR